MNTRDHERPRGTQAMGVFFVLGAVMTAFAAVTLVSPGTVLDRLWLLNKSAHAQLATFGRTAGFGFAVLSVLFWATSVGWFRRRTWAWVIGTGLITVNAFGDVVNFARGERLKGAVGAIIAALLLVYLTRRQMRDYFRQSSCGVDGSGN